jgi:hypothetical protein
MRNVFKDPKTEREFQKNGYVILPFLNDDEVTSLKNSYFNTLNESGGIHAGEKSDDEISYDLTFINKNVKYKKNVFKMITDVFDKNYKNVLDNYKPIIANYIRKKENGGEVPMHQNWAFANEMKCSTVTIWCPLTDSTKANGTFQLVPGSHKRFGKTRGPMIPSELLKIEKEIIGNYMIPIEINAGQMLILDDSIVHYSAPNTTDGLRLAIQLILIPKEENSIHYYYDREKDNGLVEVLDVDHEFYMSFNPWKKVDDSLNRFSFIKHNTEFLTIKEFDKKLKARRFDKLTTFQKVLNYFEK